MPRIARIILPNLPHHVMHRGHNRHVVFAHDAEYQHYLDNLWEWKQTLGCRVYAYCLMTNHVHLVVDPAHNPARLRALMKRVAGRQTRQVIIKRMITMSRINRNITSPVAPNMFWGFSFVFARRQAEERKSRTRAGVRPLVSKLGG